MSEDVRVYIPKHSETGEMDNMDVYSALGPHPSGATVRLVIGGFEYPCVRVEYDPRTKTTSLIAGSLLLDGEEGEV